MAGLGIGQTAMRGSLFDPWYHLPFALSVLRPERLLRQEMLRPQE
jgi:hypothetical protein